MMGKKEEIGIRIRTMRKSRRMTQGDLAKVLGQSSSSITMYETGRRSPDYETLETLADIFNVPLSFIVGDNNDTDSEAFISSQVDPEISIVSGMMEGLPLETKQQIVAIVRALVTQQQNKKG